MTSFDGPDAEGMSFEDLPENWRELPLDDDRLVRDVLDLFVSMKARYHGALVVLMCNANRRIVQPIQVDEIELNPPADTDVMLNNLVVAILGASAESCVLVALARPGPLRVGARDEAWARFIEGACRDRLPLIGVHLVTPRGSLPMSAAQSVA